MNPILMQLLARFGPTALKAMGLGGGAVGTAFGALNANSQGDVLNDPKTIARIQGYVNAQAPAASFNARHPVAPGAPPPNGPTPNEMVAQGHNMFGPTPLQTAEATPAPLPSPPALSAQAMAPQAAPQAPMPQARPVDAPASVPDMGFFARNTAMMRDPSSGAFIDPANAEHAQASGPDVINKLMSYFHTKDTPS